MSTENDRVTYVLDAIYTRVVQGEMPTTHQIERLRAGDTCNTCRGSGLRMWGSTAMGSGIGGQTMTLGPCPGTRRSAMASDCPFVEPRSVG